MILVLYLGHEIFHPVAVFLLFPNQFSREGLKLPKLMNLRQKVVHLYRRTRLHDHVCTVQEGDEN